MRPKLGPSFYNYLPERDDRDVNVQGKSITQSTLSQMLMHNRVADTNSKEDGSRSDQGV